jgi:hypothetical protein
MGSLVRFERHSLLQLRKYNLQHVLRMVHASSAPGPTGHSAPSECPRLPHNALPFANVPEMLSRARWREGGGYLTPCEIFRSSKCESVLQPWASCTPPWPARGDPPGELERWALHALDFPQDGSSGASGFLVGCPGQTASPGGVRPSRRRSYVESFFHRGSQEGKRNLCF